MGANPDADTSIYSRAISISDQRFTEEPRYETVEKKVIRRAEVPFLRKVKGLLICLTYYLFASYSQSPQITPW
jgi:hypothetical protein